MVHILREDVVTCMYVVDKPFVVVWTLVQGLFLFGFISSEVYGVLYY